MAQVIVNNTLGKENFWNEMMDKYPKSMKEFCKWIDKYKKVVNWDKLFAANENTDQLHSSRFKFHEIPYEMQQGIWICFAYRVLIENFEQPEYTYCGILEDDVRMVFTELEQFEELN